MKTTSPPAPLVVVAISPPVDDAIAIVKWWLTSNGYTSDDVRIRINDDSVWAELKEGATLR